MRLRQRAQRRPTRVLVTFWRPREVSDYREGRIVDLSPTGCFVVTERPFPPPSKVQVRLVVGEDPLDLQVEVVRTIGSPDGFQKGNRSGMGVRFRHPASESVQKLLEYACSR